MKIATARINSNGQIARKLIPPNKRAALIKKANFICQRCKNKFLEDDLEIDHIYPEGFVGRYKFIPQSEIARLKNAK